jgi:hypothetical protein
MKGLLAILLFLVLVVVGAAFNAFPVMWLLNGLIAPAFLLYVFGTTHIGFWAAYGIALLCGILFKGGYSTSTSSK